MALGTWWRGDPLLALPALPFFTIRGVEEPQLIMRLNKISEEEFYHRQQAGNHAYIAYLQETPVAYGWVGTQRGGVREIQLAFTLPPGNRYLWNFETLAPWRGRNIYSHFLQAILRQEINLAERFWILYEPGNDIAARSISKAGFEFVGELTLTDGHVSGIDLFHNSERAYIGASILGLPVTT